MATKPHQAPAHDVADLSLAPAGEARIAWAAGQMPVLARIARPLRRRAAARGATVGLCLHVTAETAILARALRGRRRGRRALRGQPALHAGRRRRRARRRRPPGGPRASTARTSTRYAAHVGALVAREPDITLDDGADLVTVLHEARARGRRAHARRDRGDDHRPRAPARRWRPRGASRCPVIAVNEARTERAFNDRYGTGQSTIDGILRATNVLLAGAVVVVLGYGWTGKGIALRAQGLGAQRHRLRGRPDPRARGADGGLPGHDGARGGRARGHLHHRHRRHGRALRAEHFTPHEGRRDPRERRALRRRDRPRRARAPGGRAPRGAPARRGVRARRAAGSTCSPAAAS